MEKGEEIVIGDVLEERADYLSDSNIQATTVTGDFFDGIHRSLMARGTKLLVGPRGCGKTHIMRYTWLRAKNETSLPLCIYVSFNRYYRLEPLLKTKANAIETFHLWTLCRILEGLSELFPADSSLKGSIGVESDILESIITKCERGQHLSESEQVIAADISISFVVKKIEFLTKASSRARAVILLDDAALTLTPEYLHEFFDIVRSLKTPSISPKASVYPGTTEYGPRFHVHHEADIVNVWLSPDDEHYCAVMGAIAERRFSGLELIPEDVSAVLMYASFGVPRAYLMMLREYARSAKNSPQAKLNSVIEDHYKARISEYKSLELKMPKFSSLIEVGEVVFRKITDDLSRENIQRFESTEKQLLVGVSDLDHAVMAQRMFNLLIEAGLLYEHPAVSHGESRSYKRFTPHLTALMAKKAFSGNSKGASPRHIVDFLRRKPTKHPLRRSLRSLLSQNEIEGLRINLSACSSCGTERMNDAQKFCHHCGAELLQVSTFNQCMSIKLVEMPGFTPWQRSKMSQLQSIKTIGELLAAQDPGTELRTLHMVGKKRAAKIIDLVSSYVDEFLS